MRPARNAWERLHGAEGTSSLELALVAPLLLVFIFLCVQTGFFFYGRTVALHAAREGVDQLRVAQRADGFVTTGDAVSRRVEAYSAALGRQSLIDPRAVVACDPAPCDVARADSEAGRVSVTVSGGVISLVPGLTLRVTGRAWGELERFESDGRPVA